MGKVEQFRQAFSEAEAVLLAFPLYTDAMPGIVKAFIETLEPSCGRAGNPLIGFMVQSGFPEATHSRRVKQYGVAECRLTHWGVYLSRRIRTLVIR